MAAGRGGRYHHNNNNERAQQKGSKGGGHHQRNQQNHQQNQQQASSVEQGVAVGGGGGGGGVHGIDFPVDISFLDVAPPISSSERNTNNSNNLRTNGNSNSAVSGGLGGGHNRRAGGGGYDFKSATAGNTNAQGSSSNYGGEKGGKGGGGGGGGGGLTRAQQTEANLFRIVGEIGRLRAIEQEIRSQGKDLQKLEQARAEVQKFKGENASLRQEVMKLVEHEKEMKQELERQNVQLLNLKKKALEDGKRFKELENALREKDQVQLKADDNFAAAMDDLVQKQRQLEVKDQQMRERNLAIDLKEKQLKEHVGAQEMREMEMQNLVWAREKQIWEMEQVHKNQLEYYKKQVDILQVELQNQEKIQMTPISPQPEGNANMNMSMNMNHMNAPHGQASSSMPVAALPERAPVSQIESWNANLPLLDQDTLISIVKKTLQTELATGTLTATGRTKLDTFLLPHSWVQNYQPIYGTLEEFIQRMTGTNANAAAVAMPPPGGFHQQVVVTPMPVPVPAKGPATQKSRKKKFKN